MSQERKGDILVLLGSMAGGFGFVFMKYLLEWGFTPFQVIAGRFLIATGILYLLYCKTIPHITKEEWKAGGILGGLLFCLFLLLTIGLQYTTPSVNAFLGNMSAVLVPFIMWKVFHKKPDSICFWMAGMAMVGVALLSITADVSGMLGAVLSFGASVAFAFQISFMGRFLEKGNPLHLALAEHLVVLVLGCIVAVIQGSAVPRLTGAAVGCFLLLGILCTAVYFLLQSLGQQYTTPAKASLLFTTEPVFAAITALMVYGERLSVQGYAGCGIIFLALVLTEVLPLWKKRADISS